MLIEYLKEQWRTFRKKNPPNRVILYITPFILAPAAGVVNAWLALHFPGLPHFSDAQVLGFFGAGAGAMIALAYKFLDGWQQHEARKANPTLAEPPWPPEPGSEGFEHDAEGELTDPAGGADDIDPSDSVPDEEPVIEESPPPGAESSQ